MHRLITIILLLLSCHLSASAQTVVAMDARMAYYMDRLDYWYSHAEDELGGADSLENNNDLFIEYLEKTVIQLDTSLVNEYTAAKKKGLHVATSPDSIMRIYSWDRKDDPDKEQIENIAAYMTYYNVRYTDLDSLEKKGKHGCYYDEIVPVRTKEGQAYFATYHRDIPRHVEGVKVFGIVKHKIEKLYLFKDKTGEYAELSYDYLPNTPGSKVLAHFSDTRDKLFIPIIKDETFSGKFMVYAFDGYKFVLEKNAR